MVAPCIIFVLRRGIVDTYDKNKGLQIEQILHYIKLSSLFFSVIAFFQYYFEGKAINITSYTEDFVILLILIITFLIYAILNFLHSGKKENRFKAWFELFAFLAISFLVILLTGSYQSNYKFLFIFVIISSSIEYRMRTSMIIVGLSSAIVLMTDLITAPNAPVNVYFESDFVLVCAFLIISWTISYYVRLENRHITGLQALVNLDGLTNLYNHRYFYESLEQKMRESKRDGMCLALLFMDIDYFKYYNDINGHQKGDEILKAIAATLKANVRKNDIISRYGGEEFAILLPNTEKSQALELAEKLRFEIQKQHFDGQEYMPNHNLTISIGVSVFPEMAKSEVELVKHADEALYKAKFLRKNTVEMYSSILDDLQNDIDENDKEIIASIKTLIAVINAKDKYTYEHIERVVSYCLLMADQLKFDEGSKKIFIYAAYMHDIGKINIPQEILNKPTRLTDDEWEALKAHPKNGSDIIKNVTELKEVVPIILQHHEHYDGTGYPNHLKGNEISYLARMLSVIDSFDAMTSNRPYQNKKTFSEAYEELIRCSGTQFDPEIVQDFIRIIKENVGEN